MKSDMSKLKDEKFAAMFTVDNLRNEIDIINSSNNKMRIQTKDMWERFSSMEDENKAYRAELSKVTRKLKSYEHDYKAVALDNYDSNPVNEDTIMAQEL